MATSTYELRTFKDIIDAICEELKIQSTDTVTRNRIRRDINIIYQDEVIPAAEWKWLRGYADLTLQPKITAGTASLTTNTKTVTLTVAPAYSVEGYWFSFEGYNERYKILQHTASSTTLTIEAVYTGNTQTAQSYLIWTDKLALPSDCRETLKITQDFMPQPLENLGLQKFRDISSILPRAENRPQFYTTSDYINPIGYTSISGLPALSTRASDGLTKTLVFASSVTSYLSAGERIKITGAGADSYNGEWIVGTVSASTVTFTSQDLLTETATADLTLSLKSLSILTDDSKYRELWVYPAVYQSRVTIHVDYIRETSPLIEDDDEPLIPLQDRIVLLYGALSRAWTRERNPEESSKNAMFYERKLNKMAGKVDDSTDTPILRPARTYLGVKRRSQRWRGESAFGGFGGLGGSSGSQSFTGTANTVAIFDSSGNLAASPTISTTELGFLNGLLSSAVGISDAQTLSNKTLNNPIVTGVILSDSGTNAAPAYSFTGNSGYGMFVGSSRLQFSVAGGAVLSVGASDILFNVSLNSTSTMTLQTGGVTWLSADSSQNATFAGNVALGSHTLTANSVIIGSATNKISGLATILNGSGTLTLPTTSDTIVGRATTDTLTNKTIDAASNTISNIANTNVSGSAAIAYSKLALSASIATGDLAAALLVPTTKGGTGVANNAASTITISGSFGTTITVSGTTTVTLPTSGTLSTLAGSETLTNKILTTPTIASIRSASGVAIQGIAANTVAAAGDVGEVIDSLISTATNAGTSLQYFDATSISLTAGHWNVSGSIQWLANGATMTGVEAGVSITTGNSASGLVEAKNYVTEPLFPNSTESLTQSVPMHDVNINSTTTHYLKGLIIYSVGTPKFKAYLRAIRVR